MKIEEVVESRVWSNATTGATASIYGACPWTSDAEREQWDLKITGWTWRLANGTIGMGRKPVDTREEAEEIMTQHNARIAR